MTSTVTDRPAVDRDADPTLRELLREDFVTHRRNRMSPGLHAIALHRISVWSNRQPSLAYRVFSRFCRVINNIVVRNIYGIELYDTTVIGRRVLIAHHQGVVLGDHAVIGDDCVIRQNVTLGMANDNQPTEAQPRVGRNVSLGAGAILVGAISIGDDVQIGPGAVVVQDVPTGARVFTPPARVMKAVSAPEQAEVEPRPASR